MIGLNLLRNFCDPLKLWRSYDSCLSCCLSSRRGSFPSGILVTYSSCFQGFKNMILKVIILFLVVRAGPSVCCSPFFSPWKQKIPRGFTFIYLFFPRGFRLVRIFSSIMSLWVGHSAICPSDSCIIKLSVNSLINSWIYHLASVVRSSVSRGKTRKGLVFCDFLAFDSMSCSLE